MDTKKLRQKILDLAIHGKLVPQDPNDEPASVLLERIRAEKEQLIKEGKIKAPKKSKSAGDTSHYPKDVPFEVPEGWAWCYLSDVGKWQSGSTPSRGVSAYYGGAIPWLKTGDLNDGYITSIPEFITEKALEETSVKLNPTGSVLIAMYGATIGKVGILTFPATTNQACCACSEFNGVYNKYLFYFLISHKDDFIRKAGGGAQPNISKEIIVTTPIPIPPAKEQERIVHAIENWLGIIDGIDSSQQGLMSKIADSKTKILDLAIHGKLVPQNPSDEPAIELLKRINPGFQPSHNLHYKAELPTGWQLCHIQDIAKAELGKTLDKAKNQGEEKPYLCALNVKWESFDLSTLKTIKIEEKEKPRYRLLPCDLLVCEGGDVGRCAIWQGDCEMYYQNALHRVRFKEGFCPDFYLYVLRYYKSLGVIDDICKGVTIKHFTGQVFNSLDLPVPPLNEQKRIVCTVKSLFEILDSITNKMDAS